MHKELADRGLVCMSVTVDDPADKEALQRAEAFLKKQNATLANFLLNEPEEVWKKRWDTELVPVIFVFDRQGKRAAKFPVSGPDGIEDVKYADIEKLVRELLDRKP